MIGIRIAWNFVDRNLSSVLLQQNGKKIISFDSDIRQFMYIILLFIFRLS